MTRWRAMPSNAPIHDACQVCGNPVYLADPPADRGVPAHWDCVEPGVSETSVTETTPDQV